MYEGGGEMNEELVRAAQRGSENAFTGLLTPLEKKLYCIAFSVVGNSCVNSRTPSSSGSG